MIPRLTSLTLLLLLTGLLAGCHPRWVREDTVFQSRTMIVELEGRPEEERAQGTPYAHPALVSPEYLIECFAQIRYRSFTLLSGSELPPACDPSIVRPLAINLADGLRRSSPHSRVRFRFDNPTPALFVLPGVSTTRGVAFVEPEGTLNLAFDLVGAVADSDDPFQNHAGWANPTRNAISNVDLVVSGNARPYISPHGVARRMWLTFDLTRPPADLPPVPEITPPPLEPPVDLTSNDEKEPMPAAPEEATAKEAGKPASADPGPASKPAKALTEHEILERLRFLEELYQDGTLTKEEYDEKRAELLK